MEIKLRVNKRAVVTTLILTVILVVYNILYFVIPFDRTVSPGSYWTTYGITMFLILFMGVVVFIGVGDKKAKSRIFGVPIIYLGYSVLITQFILDLVVMIVGNWVAIPTWVTVIIETLLLAWFFISLIKKTAYKDTIKKVDAKEYKEVYIRNLRVDLETICNMVEEPTLKKTLERLYETAKYTDPVSSKAVVDIEDQISIKVEELKKTIYAENFDEAKLIANEIDGLLKERKLRTRSSR